MIFKKTALTIFVLLALATNAQISFPNPPGQTYNGNVGINQTNPAAMLHISDDQAMQNCRPAILINSNLGSGASETPGGQGTESETCSTPYIFRNRLKNSANSTTTTTVNISSNGASVFGNIYDLPGISNTRFSIENNLGLYKSSNEFIRFGYDQTTISSEPTIYWNSADNLALSFGHGDEISSLNKILTLQNDNKVGINISSPEAALHIKSEINGPNDGITGQIQGLLIENNGHRDHDFALEIRTGQRPLDAAMTNGRVFTVSNAGTVHIGEGLNWETPTESSRYRLYVKGGIRTEKVKVEIASENNWADYVFERGYELMPWQELEIFIKENKHLPGVPSASEVVENGLDVGEMNKILLEKIEELTLRIIELEKKSQNETSLIGSWKLDSVSSYELGMGSFTEKNISNRSKLIINKDGSYVFKHDGAIIEGNYSIKQGKIYLERFDGTPAYDFSYTLNGGILALDPSPFGVAGSSGSIFFYSR